MYDSESCLENILTELIELRRHASVISRQGLPTRQACENKGKSKTKYFFCRISFISQFTFAESKSYVQNKIQVLGLTRFKISASLFYFCYKQLKRTKYVFRFMISLNYPENKFGGRD